MTFPAEAPRKVLRCPTHGQTDCSPLLNGCSVPAALADAYLTGYVDGRGAVDKTTAGRTALPLPVGRDGEGT